MVNAPARCHDRPVRRTAPPALGIVLVPLVLALALGGCASAKDRDLARYYDPEHRFSALLPAANTLSVVPPQPTAEGPTILSGVISEPPLPSPSPATQFGGVGAGLTQQAEPSDRTIYQAFAVTTDAFEDLADMALYFLTGDPSIDLKEQRPIEIDGMPGRLLVVDSVRDGQVRASVAVALTLGEGGTGYLIAAIFPPGQWEAEEPDFLRVVRSFRTEVPPLLRTYPLAGAS
jgi:hypothetical protein